MVYPGCNDTKNENSGSTRKQSPAQIVLPWKRPRAISSQAPVQQDSFPSAHARADNGNCVPLPIFPEEAKGELIDKIKRAIDPSQSVLEAEPVPLNAVELHRLYQGSTVPEHRYLSQALTMAIRSPEIGRDPVKWLADLPEINLAGVVNAWLNTNGNTDYEQLYCIGLDPDTDQLTGVLTIKQGNGYSGRPCTAGSKEYIAFWIDCGSGFHYQGTASISVYDFGWLPPAGLEYIVSLPAGLQTRIPIDGEGKKSAKVRAVLSWNTPPSTADPYAPVVWGNSIEGRIPLPSSRGEQAGNRYAPLAAKAQRKLDESGTDGLIVEAAIKALTGMAFGTYAGLTVSGENATTSARSASKSFAINAEEIEYSDYKLTLYVSNRSAVNHGAIPGSSHAPGNILRQQRN